MLENAVPIINLIVCMFTKQNIITIFTHLKEYYFIRGRGLNS